MKLSNLFLASLPLFGAVHADRDEAMALAYLYAAYDMGVDVYGVGGGYISVACRGSIAIDKRCNFNEWVNYVFSGLASNSPAYYEISSGFYFTIGTLASIGDALRQVSNAPWKDILHGERNYAGTRIVAGRESFVGLWNDISYATQRTYDHAKKLGRNVERQSANTKIALEEFSKLRVDALESKVITQITNGVKDVKLRFFERESLTRKYTRIDWDATLKANPTLLDTNSDMFKALTGTLNNFYALPENAHLLQQNAKAGEAMAPCNRWY